MAISAADITRLQETIRARNLGWVAARTSLAELSDDELNREPTRIRESYSVKARRIEPVGLIYLWPISG